MNARLRGLYRDRLFGRADADSKPERVARLHGGSIITARRSDAAGAIATQLLDPARHRRMAGRCVLFYGGRCLAWR
jgi:hypothetical protein